MFNSKYYENPFADDEDDLCYGEILSDPGDDAAHRAGPSSAEPRERQRFSVLTTGSPSAAPRRAPDHGSTEIALSAVRSTDDWDGGAHRGPVDAHDYEEYIAELRAELASANAENSRLSAAQTKAEARARGLLFDKENAEWQLQQEKERNHTLSEKVAALEAELDQLAARTSGVAAHRETAAPGHPGREASQPEQQHQQQQRTSHVDPHASSWEARHNAQSDDSRADFRPADEAQQTPVQDRQRSTRARAQFEQRQAAYLESRGGSFEREGLDATPPQAKAATHQEPEAMNASPLGASQNSGLTRSLRGQRRAEAVQDQIMQKEKLAKEQAAAVKELDDLLQTHCQKRDELALQLQRLESLRLRTVADKRKKAAVEADLEEAEKTIGQIRLELRSRSALVR